MMGEMAFYTVLRTHFLKKILRLKIMYSIIQNMKIIVLERVDKL